MPEFDPIRVTAAILVAVIPAILALALWSPWALFGWFLIFPVALA